MPKQHRRCRTAILSALAGAACLLAAQARAEDQGSIRLPETIPPLPSRTAQSLLDPPAASDTWARPGHKPLGVTLDTYALTPEQIDAAASTGCSLVRLPVPMEKFIEGAEPDWAALDLAVSRLNRAGMEIMPVLLADTAVPDFYRTFCRQVAQRYGPTFRYYQILDDVNYKIGLSSIDYAALLISVRAAIILADADAEIVLGGLRGVDLTYLGLLERQGALAAFDITAFNLFPPPDGIETIGRRLRSEHSLAYMEDAVAWSRSHGKEAWVTSLGVSTDLSWVGVDQPLQASILSRAPLYLGYIGVSRIMLQCIQDSDPSYTRPAACCGVLDVSGQPKASFFALRALNRAVSGAYHASPAFTWQGTTYQQPSAEDLFIAPELIGIPGMDALAEYEVHNLPVYCFWFYAPASREYRLIYWLGSSSTYPALLSLLLMYGSERPFIDQLRPLDAALMIDNVPTVITNPIHAQNMLMVERLRLDGVPGVVRFQASGANGGA